MPNILTKKWKDISRSISLFENNVIASASLIKSIKKSAKNSTSFVLGVTGTGGAGKSSFVDEIVRRLLKDFHDINIGIVCVDPSKKKQVEHY